jgi:hypothetical protein
VGWPQPNYFRFRAELEVNDAEGGDLVELEAASMIEPQPIPGASLTISRRIEDQAMGVQRVRICCLPDEAGESHRPPLQD